MQYPIQAECGSNFIESVVYRRLRYEAIIPSRSNIVLELFNGIRSTWMVVGSAIRSIREYLKREFHLLRIIIISLLILRRERNDNALSLRSGPIIQLHIGNELDQRPKHYHMSCRVRLTIHPINRTALKMVTAASPTDYPQSSSNASKLLLSRVSL